MVSLRQPSGQIQHHRIAGEPFTARVRNGMAAPEFLRSGAGPGRGLSHAQLEMPAIAIADAGGQPSQREFAFRDRDGRRHEMVIVREGKRLTAARHYVDGELFLSLAQDWKRSGSLWTVTNVRGRAFAAGNEAEFVTDFGLAGVQAPSALMRGRTGFELAASGIFELLGPEEAYANCEAELMRLAQQSGLLAIAIASGNWLMIAVYGYGYISAAMYYGSCE